MKAFCFLTTLLLLFSCKPHRGQKEVTQQPTKVKTIDNKTDSFLCDTAGWYKIPAERDSVLIYDNDGEKVYYKKGELNRILLSYPELNEDEMVLTPDETYARRGMRGKLQPCDVHLGDCGVCQDNYYTLYAYFLKQRNGEINYRKERENLIALFRDINHIYMKLAVGGTYFGHQYRRIVAYAEYDIYLKKENEDFSYYSRSYGIAKQKRLYLDGLTQLIIDEIDNNMEIHATEKPTLKKELSQTVAHIDSLLSNYFYLKMTQKFEHSNY